MIILPIVYREVVDEIGASETPAEKRTIRDPAAVFARRLANSGLPAKGGTSCANAGMTHVVWARGKRVCAELLHSFIQRHS